MKFPKKLLCTFYNLHLYVLSLEYILKTMIKVNKNIERNEENIINSYISYIRRPEVLIKSIRVNMLKAYVMMN